MMGITGESLLDIWEGGKRKNLYTYHNEVHFFMFHFTWEMHFYFCLKEISIPLLFFISKKYEVEDQKVLERIKIRIKDFYNNAIGEII